MTGHRRENFGEGLRSICLALRDARRSAMPTSLIVYPVHLNPAVQRPVREILAGHPNIVLTPPLDYLPFVDLMRRAYLILTDSGGLQEEAPSLGVPVLVMRETTERPEARRGRHGAAGRHAARRHRRRRLAPAHRLRRARAHARARRIRSATAPRRRASQRTWRRCWREARTAA